MKTMLVLLWCFAMTAIAAGNAVSEVSVDLSRHGLSELVQGNISNVANSSKLSVVTVQPLGQFMTVTLKALAGTATIAIKISAVALDGVSLFAGQTIDVVTTASGYLLKAGDRAVAFLPSDLGRTLIYSNQL